MCDVLQCSAWMWYSPARDCRCETGCKGHAFRQRRFTVMSGAGQAELCSQRTGWCGGDWNHMGCIQPPVTELVSRWHHSWLRLLLRHKGSVIILPTTHSLFQRPFSRWTWVSRYQNVSILDFVGAKGDGDGGNNWSYKTCLTDKWHTVNIQATVECSYQWLCCIWYWLNCVEWLCITYVMVLRQGERSKGSPILETSIGFRSWSWSSAVSLEQWC